jgi:hypothetical protein
MRILKPLNEGDLKRNETAGETLHKCFRSVSRAYQINKTKKIK